MFDEWKINHVLWNVLQKFKIMQFNWRRGESYSGHSFQRIVF